MGPYSEAARLDQNWVQPVVYLGDAYRMQRLYPDAKSTYQKALAIDPKSADAMYWLGAIAVTEQNLTLAREYHARLKPIDAAEAAKLLEFISPKTN